MAMWGQREVVGRHRYGQRGNDLRNVPKSMPGIAFSDPPLTLIAAAEQALERSILNNQIHAAVPAR